MKKRTHQDQNIRRNVNYERDARNQRNHTGSELQEKSKKSDDEKTEIRCPQVFIPPHQP